MFQRLNKSKAVAILLVILVFVGGGMFGYNTFFNDSEETVMGTIEYPAGWVELELEADEIASGVEIKAGRNNPYASLVARVITGPLDESVNIDKLPDQIEAGFETELSDYQTISKKVAKLGSYDSVQIRYKQTNDSGKTVEDLSVIVPTQNKTFYLTFSSGEASFLAVEEEIMQIANYFVSYIDLNK